MNKIDEWKKQIESITLDVQDLLYSKSHAYELEEIIKSNVFVRSSVGSFWQHYKLNYIYFVVSKIWHQIDEDSRSLSLLNLLNDILNNYKLITKSWWVSQDPGSLSSAEFERKFGKGKEIDPLWVKEDIQKLKDVIKPIIEIRHKRIAHKDIDEDFSYSVGGTEVNKAMSTIEELVIKYQLLLTQSGHSSLTPVPDDWTKAFTVPWIIKK